MKKLILASAFVTSILLVSACTDKEVTETNNVIASTKAGDITKEDLYEEMKDSIGTEVLENLILLKAIENEFKVSEKEIDEAIKAEKDKYGDSFDLYLLQNNTTEPVFMKKVEFQLYQQKMIESLDDVPAEEIEAQFENMKKEIHARHILVADEKTADEVSAKLKDGEDFEKLAREYSTEPVAQKTGGDLGWFGIGKMVQPFEDVAFELELNTISEPVQSTFGFHIIEVLETKEKELEKTFEELKPEIENNLKAQLFEEKLVVLLKNVGVEIKDDEFKSVLNEYITADVKE